MACAAEESDSVFFVRETTLAKLGRIPRRCSDPSFENGHPNDNVHEAVQNFDPTKTCFASFSYWWLRAASGCPHDAQNRQCKLILAAARSLRRGPTVVVPEGFEFALWIDYGCLDQDCPGVASQLVSAKIKQTGISRARSRPEGGQRAIELRSGSST